MFIVMLHFLFTSFGVDFSLNLGPYFFGYMLFLCFIVILKTNTINGYKSNNITILI